MIHIKFFVQPESASGTIKEQLAAIAPALEQLWKQKEKRVKEFFDVQSEIQKICGEITGSLNISENPVVDESQLSVEKLDEYHCQLQELQKEKVSFSLRSYIFCLSFFFHQANLGSIIQRTE